MHVALVSGFWGQNIGNAFFNLGGEAVLEAAGHLVSKIQDQPAYWTFRAEAKGNYLRAWPIIEKLDVDVVVLQGPLLTRNFGNVWLPTLRRLQDRGVKWGLLSCGFRSYDSTELTVAAEVFQEIPPAFAGTRDSDTAERLRPLLDDVHAGVDSAFFLPWAYKPPRLDKDDGPYLNLCFDHFIEPRIRRAANGPLRIGDCRYVAAHSSRLQSLAGRSKVHAYLAQFLSDKNPPETLDGMQVVRPEHRTNPHLPFKIYRQPNAIAADEPWTYLTIYANGVATISDRVHACVATLAYGGAAHLYNPTTKRKALFEAIGAGGISDSLVTLGSGVLDEKFERTCQFLSDR